MAERDVDAVRDRLQKLKEAFRDLEASHDLYHETLTEDADIDASEQWFRTVQNDYKRGVDFAHQWLDSMTVPNIASASAAATAATVSVPVTHKSNDSDTVNADTLHQDLVNVLNVPRLEIDKFSGDPMRYQTFMNAFDDLVDSHISEGRVKLTRLLQYTDGPAKLAIQNCALVSGEKGYRRAREILKRRFGNAHLVSQKIINELRHGKSVHKSYELQKLADELSVAYTVLEDIDKLHEIDTQISIIDIAQRCPQFVHDKWRNKAIKHVRTHDCYPTFFDFVEFIELIAVAECDPVYGKGNNSKPANVRGVNYSTVTATVRNSGDTGTNSSAINSVNFKSVPSVYVVCGGNHRPFVYDKFKSMGPKVRREFVVRNKLCFNCLLPCHRANECRKPSVCSIPGCGQKHTRFIHIDPPQPGASGPAHNVGNAQNVAAQSQPSEAGNGSSVSQVLVGNVCADELNANVFMPMVEVTVNGTLTTYALLDSGSTNSFITKSLAEKLNLPGRPVNYHMSTLSDDKRIHSKLVSLSLSSQENGTSVSVDNVVVTDKIPARCPGEVVDVSKYPHLSGLSLVTGVKAELIIGNDNPQITMPLEVRCNRKSSKDPYAVRTLFSWTLNGPMPDGVSSRSVYSHHVSVSLENQVENLWRMDADDDVTSYSVEDGKVLELWNKEITHDNGHYSLPIPWRDGNPSLPDNRFLAKWRLNSLVNKLDRTNMRERYSQEINKLVEQGYAEPVPDDEINLRDGSVWYLPHHHVLNDSKPDKVCVVFYCAAKHSDISLNNQCLQGPDLNNKLIAVLLRFRQFRYAIMADVQSMYLQVQIPLKDRNALRFMWVDGDLVRHFRMTSHLFGGVWCASSATFALRRTVQDCEVSDITCNTVNHAFYVDDLLKSVHSRSDALEVIHGTRRALGHGGFLLTKFVVNDSHLLQEIGLNERAKEVMEITPDALSRALGIRWDVSHDAFFYVCDYADISHASNVTRRQILSQVSSMYDPLGLIAPVVIRGRMIFQETSRLKLDWDESVPDWLRRMWVDWLCSLQFLGSLRFPKCVIPEEFAENGVHELHHFCDGSQSGYGACSYVRSVNAAGHVHVALVASKGRLAPLKQMTIPRLELAAAVLAVRLDVLLRRELEVPLLSSTFWSDSEIVLSYIKNEGKRYKTFVANRVSEIRQSSSPNQWHHVKGQDNPADVLSRGCLVSELSESWYHGPEFAGTFKCDWPQQVHADVSVSEDDEEIRPGVTLITAVSDVESDEVATHPVDVLLAHCSSYYRMKKAMCWWLRVKDHLRGRMVRAGPIVVSEMKAAEVMILGHVQASVYPEEVKRLREGLQVLKSSPLLKLSPGFKDGLIVVGGRIGHGMIPTTWLFPVILPRDHRLSQLIVQEYHGQCHLGTEWLLSKIRTRFWITKARSLIKKVKRQCVICKKLYAFPMVQKMADLPPERCLPFVRPFSVVGVDIFGPFYVRQGRAQVKRYGCVFTCFNIRAIHLEKLNGMDTDTFINAFVRFASRRGYPQKVWCDNGTNLVGARSELKKCLQEVDKDRVIQMARRHEVEWVFNPSHASHHGGVWERMIRTVRRILVALLNANSRMTDDVMHTVLCDRECCEQSSDFKGQ